MNTHDVTWVLVNRQSRSLAKHIKRLSKLLLRTCPDEFVIVKIICTYHNGEADTYDVHRQLDTNRISDICDFFKGNEKELSSFLIQFISFSHRKNTRFTLSGLAPFDHINLLGENIPAWLHEMINRRFEPEIGFTHKLWSFIHNHRPFKHSLGG